MKKYLVVIPYLAKDAQGSELELAVSGWRKHFKEPYHIVVVGDVLDFEKVILQIRIPDDAEDFSKNWLKHSGTVQKIGKYSEKYKAANDITYIHCPRIEPVEGQYLPHLDIVHKFRTVREFFPDSEGFIYACDDMYAVKDFTMQHVLVPKLPHEGDDIRKFDWRKESGWMSDLGKTRELCEREGFTQKNWVCHLPVFYEWDRLLDIYDKYDCDHESYIVENIYYNQLAIHYAMNGIQVLDADYFQYEVKTSHPGIESAEDAWKIWITNANTGWSRSLEDILRKHYQLV